MSNLGLSTLRRLGFSHSHVDSRLDDHLQREERIASWSRVATRCMPPLGLARGHPKALKWIPSDVRSDHFSDPEFTTVYHNLIVLNR